jgi:hypothetical protein
MGKNGKPITVPGGTIIKVRNGKWLSNRLGSAAQGEHPSRQSAVAFLASKPTSREANMKVKAKAAKATKASKAKASKAAPKRENLKHDNDALRKQIAKRVGTARLASMAEALHITAGKAAYLNMLNEVDADPRLRIKGRNEDEIVANAVKAREVQDEYSSWGWLSARSGIAEGRLKTLCEAAGVKVKGSHVAKERAASKPKPAAKVKAKASKGKKDPSK